MLGEPLRKLQCWEGLGSRWVRLEARWEGLRASWEGLRASWVGPEKKEKENGAFLVYGGTIGHRFLRGRCPKVHLGNY